MGNGVGVGVDSTGLTGVGVAAGVGVGWTVGIGAVVAATVFPAGDGLATGAVTLVGVGNGVGVGLTRAVGVGPAGIVGVAVARSGWPVDPGVGVSSPGTGVLAPADRMVGAGVETIPREHATMATVANKKSRAPGRDLIRITMA